MPRRTFSLRVSLHVPARRFLTRYPSHLFLSDGLRCRPSSVSASRPGAGALRPPKFGCEVSVGRDRAEPNRTGLDGPRRWPGTSRGERHLSQTLAKVRVM
ncbi:hypothetical protein GN956_G23244 [Arapaima gigas]